MSIKNHKPSNSSGFIQGYYNLKNPEKYVGPKPIIYRSSWEHKWMLYCDNHPDVIKWSSEPVEIKYWCTQSSKYRKYYPDGYMKVRQASGKIKDILVEIKPKSHFTKPEVPKRKTKKAIENFKYIAEQFVRNMDKRNAAKKWSKNRGWEFLIITEDFLYGNGKG